MILLYRRYCFESFYEEYGKAGDKHICNKDEHSSGKHTHGICDYCPIGHGFDFTQDKCIPCTGNEFSRDTKKNCDTCSQEIIKTNNLHTDCKCRTGSQFNSELKKCQSCPPGYEIRNDICVERQQTKNNRAKSEIEDAVKKCKMMWKNIKKGRTNYPEYEVTYGDGNYVKYQKQDQDAEWGHSNFEDSSQFINDLRSDPFFSNGGGKLMNNMRAAKCKFEFFPDKNHGGTSYSAETDQNAWMGSLAEYDNSSSVKVYLTNTADAYSELSVPVSNSPCNNCSK